jgi:pyridoxal phosphate-dependent aminotransferase EpsN
MYRVYLSPPHLGHIEKTQVLDTLAQNWIAPVGPQLDAFERQLCEYTQASAAVALQSGTAAIHLALRLLDVGAGDEVICPTNTFVATANPILYQGGTPVFVESEAASWNICPDTLEQAIKARQKRGKKPKAILVVHLYGQPAAMSHLRAIAQTYDIPLIEDAAEALGATYEGNPVGALGDMGILSFNGNKIITTGGGGALLLNDKTLAQRALYLATQARLPAPYYLHEEPGYNYRMSNLLAAVGLGQMEVLAERVRQRQAIKAFYQAALPLRFQPQPKNTVSNAWLSCVRFANAAIRAKAEQTLLADGIECRRLWNPLHTQPLFAQAPYYGDGFSEKLFEDGLALPSGSALSKETLEEIIEHIQRCL